MLIYQFHLITILKTLVEIRISNITVISEEKVKLLEIHTDNRLNFDYYISQLCKNAWKRLHAPIANAFIMSHISNCPLIWIFHSRSTELRIE